MHPFQICDFFSGKGKDAQGGWQDTFSRTPVTITITKASWREMQGRTGGSVKPEAKFTLICLWRYRRWTWTRRTLELLGENKATEPDSFKAKLDCYNILPINVIRAFGKSQTQNYAQKNTSWNIYIYMYMSQERTWQGANSGPIFCELSFSLDTIPHKIPKHIQDIRDQNKKCGVKLQNTRILQKLGNLKHQQRSFQLF